MDIIMSDSMNYITVDYQSEAIPTVPRNEKTRKEETKEQEQFDHTYSSHEETVNLVDESNSNEVKLRFDNFLKVVLIPSRFEFKEASCDLWWTNSDYLLFQQSASSEIRLLALYESIPLKDARRKLYQPQEHDLIYNNNDYEDTYYEINTPTPIDNSPVEDVENKNNNEVIRQIHKVSSIECIAAKKIKHSLMKPNNLNDISNEKDNLLDKYLSLCVPLEKVELLSFKERPSKKQNQWNLLSIFGVLSLPIVGYYLLNIVYS